MMAGATCLRPGSLEPGLFVFQDKKRNRRRNYAKILYKQQNYKELEGFYS